MGLERTAFLINRITWRSGMACASHQAWYEKKRESWLFLGLGVVQELLARIEELSSYGAMAGVFQHLAKDLADAEDVLAEPLPDWPEILTNAPARCEGCHIIAKLFIAENALHDPKRQDRYQAGFSDGKLWARQEAEREGQRCGKPERGLTAIAMMRALKHYGHLWRRGLDD